MLTFPLENWADVEKTLCFTEKNKTIYVYAYSDRVYIGTADEIYSELRKTGMDLDPKNTDEYFYMGDYLIPRDNSGFLTTMQIKCIN